MNFSVVPLKVQIWGLPPHCKTSKMSHRIGACLGTVKDSEIWETRDKGSFIKVTIDFDTNSPLKAGINVGSQTDGVMWVDFRYERLPQFCYACDLVDHEESYCTLRDQQRNKDDDEENVLGPWLRAAQIGRRSLVNNKSTPSQPRQAPTPRKTQLSKDMMDMLASLSVSKAHPAAPDVVQTTETNTEDFQDPTKTATPDHEPKSHTPPSGDNFAGINYARQSKGEKSTVKDKENVAPSTIAQLLPHTNISAVDPKT
ncbi:Zinc knuckle CX2CX4HX4C [Sesbania bispinosa]|nr:Zinc knuckle CX2CX4HX4C [Sesbania bispinosa]